MTSTTSAGSTLAISVGNPSTEDLAGYGALSFVEVGQIDKIGTVGAVYAKTEFQPLRGPKMKFKGSVDYGALSPTLALDDADAGQALLRTASDDASSKLYSFVVTYPTGAKRFFQGRVFGFPEMTDGADSIITASPTIEVSTIIVRQAPGAVIPPPPTYTPPTITISAAQSKAEGNSGTTLFTYTLTRAGDLSQASSVNWAVEAGVANAADFVGGALPFGTVNFPAGSATQTFDVPVLGDTTVEPDETFIVSLSSPSNATLGTPASATGTILNDDVASTSIFLTTDSGDHLVTDAGDPLTLETANG